MQPGRDAAAIAHPTDGQPRLDFGLVQDRDQQPILHVAVAGSDRQRSLDELLTVALGLIVLLGDRSLGRVADSCTDQIDRSVDPLGRSEAA
jgi:hypothetical protein